MNSDKKGQIKLSDGWVVCSSKSNPGRKYYFNKRTGKSSWSQPQANEKSDRKPKSKKEKVHRDKCKKEELQKKNLKRKNEGVEEQSSNKNKKQRKETSHLTIPQKYKNKKESAVTASSSSKSAHSNLKPSPSNTKATVKTTPTSAKKTVPENIQTPIKNAANQRLLQLRTRLSADIQDDSSNSNEKSPIKAKQKISPKPQSIETKNAKIENKSPNVNDAKCTATTQSPSSDSLQSIPSPSQFFAANKIISSMKAQLPEEYCDKAKQKDTFADIEQGICNQTSEYPYMKHPATPPQFSEASKLVSAIKSKLTKVVSKETTVTSFSSANERLAALRTSLNNESMEIIESDNSLVINNEERCTTEAMDVDCKELPPKQTPPLVNCAKDNVNSNLVLVVDTNIFIHELDVIKNVLNSNIKGYAEQPTLLVPWRVVNELDRLKDNNNCSGAIWKRARLAMDYLYKSIPENSRIRGQPLRDANSHIYPCESPDDEILNCCLQQAERGKSVILLSNDKNLCSKALINNIKNIGLNEIKGLLENKPQKSDPNLYDNLKHYQDTIYQLLANILENEMRAKYNNLWQHILFKAPPWTLDDVLQCLLKHWIAVFNEVFPRIEHLFKDLKNNLACVESKSANTLSESEVSTFKELCLDIARKCQIIPEYMELAKLTVDRLLRSRTSEEQDGNGEMVVIDAFEGVWTVMSSYCAKLSNCLGVQHNIEDKIPGQEPLEVLTTKLVLFSNQISAFALAIKGVLNTDAVEFSIEDQVSQLESVFKDSLQLICMDAAVVNRNNLRIFCIKCKNMLQEAYTKFSQLTELIEICKIAIANK
ncbi:unnamed protein product [Arctia plantaginis]|uniref:WW domain-containing protein n=1 Tax=Arctia plantaginis TaxID=874455 RepID=A0A8S0ZP90_ARCPL|nr:unnamed protein product [Arctia plantaginis]